MSKIKMHWVCNTIPTEQTLHCLYTSIRFLENKVDLEIAEEFKIWKDGKNIYLIMDENHIENDAVIFSFFNGKILCKLISKKNFSIMEESFLFDKKFDKTIDPFFTLAGHIIYTYKYRQNASKVVEVCPIGINGLIKKHEEKPTLFLDYLQRETGLDFLKYAGLTEKVRFERVFSDEKTLYDSINGTVSLGNNTKLIRNVISIHANLPSINKVKTRSLFYNSIGKKRNYGFGSFSLE